MPTSSVPPPYGSTVIAVEPHGLDAIDAAERHGRPRDLFALWFGANAETATFAIGLLAVALYGTSLAGAAFGLLIGNLAGYGVMGLLSQRGPRLGVPQMVISRIAFGRDGNALPAVLAFLAGVGWFAIDSVFGAQALGALVHIGYGLALAFVLLAQIVLAVYGHNAIHAFERVASILLLFGFAVVAVAVLPYVRPGIPAAGVPYGSGGEIAGIIFSASLAFAYALGWGPSASDYARYLPAGSDSRKVAWWAFLGGFVPSTVLEILGAAVVTATKAPGLASATPATVLTSLPNENAFVAAVGLIAILVGTLSANCMNLYSGSLAALVAYDARRRLSSALGIAAILAVLTVALLIAARINDPAARFAPWIVAVAAAAVGALAFAVVRWTLARWQAALSVGVLGGALAYASADPAATAHLYENFLGLLTTWAAPWAGVLIATRGATEKRVDTAALGA